MVGFVGALILPTLSMFLAKEIGVRPLLVGIPFAGLAVAGMAYNYFIGRWSDGVSDRRPLVAACCLVGCLVCVTLAFSKHYWLVAGCVVIFLSFAMVSFSQIMAYSLDYAKHNIPGDRIPLFNAIVRAQIAIAWVAGPPTGFLVASYMGFKFMYLFAATMFIVIAILSLRLLPRLQSQQNTDQQESKKPPLERAQKRALILSLIGFSLMWGANNAYLISFPLHLKDGLGIGTQWMGWVMGTAAGLEIPFMLLAGYYASRIKIMSLINLAGIAALGLYLGVYFGTELWQFFALQIFNAMFIGILAGLGVSLIQDLLPGRSGMASGLYTNTTHMGNLLSSLVVSVVADIYGYHQVFAVNLAIILFALVVFNRVYVKSAKV
ncbi:MAG: MFS transporter [Gammaproteobacteria bacterium]|nr:MAG: MFS transporter [Gammaproteobacteria bacterium]